MMLISEVQSDSVRSLRKKERIFEQLSLSQFPAENVKALNNQVLDICDELERAGVLPDDAILTIVEKYTAATSDEFKIHWLTKRSAVEDHLKMIAGKDASVIAALPNRITFRSLTAESSEKYQGLLDNGSWVPANADKGAAPQVFMTQADVEGLLKQSLDTANKGGGGGGLANVTCFNCGQKGHVASKCTSPATPGAAGGGADRAWMKIRPPAGAPEAKDVNGKPFSWCERCMRWTTTHQTSTHRTKAEVLLEKSLRRRRHHLRPPKQIKPLLSPVEPCSKPEILEEPGNGVRLVFLHQQSFKKHHFAVYTEETLSEGNGR